MLFCEYLGQFTILKMHTLFFKKVLVILRKSIKHANFWIGVQFPLRGTTYYIAIILYFKFKFFRTCLYFCIFRNPSYALTYKQSCRKDKVRARKPNICSLHWVIHWEPGFDYSYQSVSVIFHFFSLSISLPLLLIFLGSWFSLKNCNHWWNIDILSN